MHSYKIRWTAVIVIVTFIFSLVPGYAFALRPQVISEQASGSAAGLQRELAGANAAATGALTEKDCAVMVDRWKNLSPVDRQNVLNGLNAWGQEHGVDVKTFYQNMVTPPIISAAEPTGDIEPVESLDLTSASADLAIYIATGMREFQANRVLGSIAAGGPGSRLLRQDPTFDQETRDNLVAKGLLSKPTINVGPVSGQGPITRVLAARQATRNKTGAAFPVTVVQTAETRGSLARELFVNGQMIDVDQNLKYNEAMVRPVLNESNKIPVSWDERGNCIPVMQPGGTLDAFKPIADQLNSIEDDDTVVIIYGDDPLLNSPEFLYSVTGARTEKGADIVIVTTPKTDIVAPYGGTIVKADGRVMIVEADQRENVNEKGPYADGSKRLELTKKWVQTPATTSDAKYKAKVLGDDSENPKSIKGLNLIEANILNQGRHLSYNTGVLVFSGRAAKAAARLMDKFPPRIASNRQVTVRKSAGDPEADTAVTIRKSEEYLTDVLGLLQDPELLQEAGVTKPMIIMTADVNEENTGAIKNWGKVLAAREAIAREGKNKAKQLGISVGPDSTVEIADTFTGTVGEGVTLTNGAKVFLDGDLKIGANVTFTGPGIVHLIGDVTVGRDTTFTTNSAIRVVFIPKKNRRITIGQGCTVSAMVAGPEKSILTIYGNIPTGMVVVNNTVGIAHFSDADTDPNVGVLPFTEVDTAASAVGIAIKSMVTKALEEHKLSDNALRLIFEYLENPIDAQNRASALEAIKATLPGNLPASDKDEISQNILNDAEALADRVPVILDKFNKFATGFNATLDNCEVVPSVVGRMNKNYFLQDRAIGKRYVVQELGTFFDPEAIEYQLISLELAQEAAERDGQFLPGGKFENWTKVKYYNVTGREEERGKHYYIRDGQGIKEAWRVMEFAENVKFYRDSGEIPKAYRNHASKELAKGMRLFAELLAYAPKDRLPGKEPLPSYHNTEEHVKEVRNLLAGETANVLPSRKDRMRPAQMIPGLLDDTADNPYRQYKYRTMRLMRIFNLLTSKDGGDIGFLTYDLADLRGPSDKRDAIIRDELNRAIETLSHCDPKFDNVGFKVDSATGEPICATMLVDLDTMQKTRMRFIDLSDAVHFIINIAGENPWEKIPPLPFSSVGVNKDIFENFIEGYLEGYSEAEKEALRPHLIWATAKIACELAMRFFKAYISEYADTNDPKLKERNGVYFSLGDVPRDENGVPLRNTDKNLRLAEVRFKVALDVLRLYADELGLDRETINSLPDPIGWEAASTAAAAGQVTIEDAMREVNKFWGVNPVDFDFNVISAGRINPTFGLTNRETSMLALIAQKVNEIFDAKAVNHNARLWSRVQDTALPQGWRRVDCLDIKGSGDKISPTRWRLMKYVPGQIFDSFQLVPEIDRMDAAVSLGEAIVEARKMFEAVPEGEQWGSPLPNFHNHHYHADYLDKILAGESVPLSLATAENTPVVQLLPGILYGEYKDRITNLLAEIEQRRRLVSSVDHLGNTKAVHGDFAPKNVIYDKNARTGKLEVVAVIDLDTIQPGNVLDDLSDALRVAASPTGENPVDDSSNRDISKVYIDMKTVNAVVEGFLRKTGEYYGQAEAERLKPYINDAIMAFWHEQTIRFLADFLTGNNYYRLKDTDKPDEYLWLAEVQMHILQEFEKAITAEGIAVVIEPDEIKRLAIIARITQFDFKNVIGTGTVADAQRMIEEERAKGNNIVIFVINNSGHELGATVESGIGAAAVVTDVTPDNAEAVVRGNL